MVAEAGAGFVAMHMQGEPRTMQTRSALRRRRRRGRRLPGRSGSHARARRGHRRPRAVRRPRHRVRQDRRPTISRCSRGSAELVARVDVPVLVGTSRKAFIGFRDSVTRRPRPRATTAPSPPSCGRSTKALRSVRVHDVLRSTRCDCCPRCSRSTPRQSHEGRESYEGSVGAGSRAPRVLLDHQGPARGVGAARRVRARTIARCAARRS